MAESTPFHFQKQFPLGPDKTEYINLGNEGISTVDFNGQEILKVEPEALTRLANEAFKAISFMLRPSHLRQVAGILADDDATDNDKMVALTLLRNAEIASNGILPTCQDTGTAIVMGKKGQTVWTGANDEEALSKGIYKTYQEENLRYSQSVPLTMYDEVNSKTNLPAQIDLYATNNDAYEFLFMAKGGGSANKTFLYQETKALLNPKRLVEFCVEKMASLGTSACPPYHLTFVIGGTSAEVNLKTVKLASTRYYDELPDGGNEHGQAFRDEELEEELLMAAREIGIGAQFGGKYFALDVRVIRLPRHGASCPVGIGVSCSADRQAKAKITKDGVFLEKLETNPGQYIPDEWKDWKFKGVAVDLDQGMDKVREQLSKYPVTTPLSLNGTIIVARDIAHAKLRERLERGNGLPEYFKKHPVYYAGPAKTPEGMPSGSFGPTTAGRMDSYVDLFQEQGASMVMIAKGNRSQQVTDACKKHGGFYLGSIGGPAAILAQNNIKSVELVEFAELGMEAVWQIKVEDFPAFILVDDKGNDFFKSINTCPACK
ncbi:fumarate hydratase [Persicirhabdus sediminis]|uniref:Fumarate hydratase class I n=1 Tax=Persicirhabdus sediminis TaxID=454144 RepID=A0A8J7MHQ0_9BACT|nr:fumarate hydratase [Persicirhabdus sediminis]MBK1792154.1 fumarate hydratase [Persicirhabdus sediminis]